LFTKMFIGFNALLVFGFYVFGFAFNVALLVVGGTGCPPQLRAGHPYGHLISISK